VGLTYQLGILASSASVTIQARIGKQFPLSPGANGVKRFNYGKVIAIFCRAVWAYQRKPSWRYIVLFVFLGLEVTERERMEYAESADELGMTRKQGFSLREIEEQRARVGEKGLEIQEEKEKRGDVDVEHLEKIASA
jgi:SHS family lactate transporter-like MFS transporter